MKKLKYIVLTILLAVLLIPFNTFAEENEIRLYLLNSSVDQSSLIDGTFEASAAIEGYL